MVDQTILMTRMSWKWNYESTKTKWWVPYKHVQWIYNIILNSICYKIHQPTSNWNETMDMLKMILIHDGICINII
jgi:hypothetical protein